MPRAFKVLSPWSHLAAQGGQCHPLLSAGDGLGSAGHAAAVVEPQEARSAGPAPGPEVPSHLLCLRQSHSPSLNLCVPEAGRLYTCHSFYEDRNWCNSKCSVHGAHHNLHIFPEPVAGVTHTPGVLLMGPCAALSRSRPFLCVTWMVSSLLGDGNGQQQLGQARSFQV